MQHCCCGCPVPSELMAVLSPCLRFSWRTMAFESCWGSAARRSSFWREKTPQRARRCRRCWPVLTSAYEKVRARPRPPPPAATIVYSMYSPLPQTTSPFTLKTLNNHPPRSAAVSTAYCYGVASPSGDSDTSSVHTSFFSFFFLIVGTCVMLCLLISMHGPVVPARFESVNE